VTPDPAWLLEWALLREGSHSRARTRDFARRSEKAAARAAGRTVLETRAERRLVIKPFAYLVATGALAEPAEPAAPAHTDKQKPVSPDRLQKFLADWVEQQQRDGLSWSKRAAEQAAKLHFTGRHVTRSKVAELFPGGPPPPRGRRPKMRPE
jgi:hypothetical protein